MSIETKLNQSGRYWVKLSNNNGGNTTYFNFRSNGDFLAWYNGNGEYSSHRAEYTPLEVEVDMRKRFP